MSITQLYISLIVCGKVRAPVEVGAKFDISFEDGHCPVGKLSSTYTKNAILL